MKPWMSLFVSLTIASCGSQRSNLSVSEADSVNRSNFDTYCASYESFGNDAKAASIRYTIDRIRFVAGINSKAPEGCFGATAALRKAIYVSENPARSREGYVFHIGARLKEGFTEYEADPNESFSLEDIEAFSYFGFLTELYLPHGKIQDLSPLASLSNLQTLDVRNNAVATLGDALRSSNSIQYLDLSFNQLTSTKGIGGDFSLEYLDISENPVTDFSGIDAKRNLKQYFPPQTTHN